VLKSILGNIAIAAFLLLFVVINLKAFHRTGDIAYLLVAINESLWVALYLVRERAVATSTSQLDWAVTFSATFVGTLLRPSYSASILFISLGNVLIIVGIVISIVSIVFLNRSIGLVPAERSIKTRGPYRFIRHPLYASEMMSLFGYLVINISWANALIAISETALMLVRIHREERFLSRSDHYRSYLERTPWKLIPFIY
jgi:protein-S-isoprenylcysteine O-methyltransferase Ste14